MLESDIFKKLIQTLRESYDYVMIDTPPLGIVIDSANVAKVCDGTLLVVEANKTGFKTVKNVLRQLSQGKCRVLGAVLNKADISYRAYYGEYNM
jgi:Mrp family chromosome partitioning ATPase